MDRLLAMPVPIIAAMLQGFDGIEDWGVVTAFIAGVFTLGVLADKIGLLELLRVKLLGRNGNGHRKGDGKVLANQTEIIKGVRHLREQHDQRLSQSFRHPDHQAADEKAGGVESVILYQRDVIDGLEQLIDQLSKSVQATDRNSQATLARVGALERLLPTIKTEFGEVKEMLAVLIRDRAS